MDFSRDVMMARLRLSLADTLQPPRYVEPAEWDRDMKELYTASNTALDRFVNFTHMWDLRGNRLLPVEKYESLRVNMDGLQDAWIVKRASVLRRWRHHKPDDFEFEVVFDHVPEGACLSTLATGIEIERYVYKHSFSPLFTQGRWRLTPVLAGYISALKEEPDFQRNGRRLAVQYEEQVRKLLLQLAHDPEERT